MSADGRQDVEQGRNGGWRDAGAPALPGSEGQKKWDAHFTRAVDDWVTIYDAPTLWGAIHQLRRAMALRWIEELALSANERVLEVGCGAGVTTVVLAQRGHQVNAIDRVPDMLERTRHAAAQAGVGHQVITALGDAHDLTFPTATFGLVLALGVVLFLDRPQEALVEMARVVKPGGYVLLNSHNRWRLHEVLDPWLSPPLDRVRATVGAALRRCGLRRTPPYTGPLARVFANSEFDALLRSAGLIKVRAMTFGFGPFSLFGRRLFTDATGVRVHRVLQRLADRNVAVLRATGAQYLVLARKA